MPREKLDTEPGETGRLLDRSREELDRALRELRDLARGIHRAVLADRGLGAAVEALAERAPPVEVVSELPDRRLPEKVELTAYFVVSETLTNRQSPMRLASIAATSRRSPPSWLTVASSSAPVTRPTGGATCCGSAGQASDCCAGPKAPSRPPRTIS